MGNENETHSSIESKELPVARGVSGINTSVRERLQSLQFFYNDLTQDALRKMILEEGGGMQILRLLMKRSDGNHDNRELHELTLQVKRNERESYREMLAILSRDNPCRPLLYKAYHEINVEIKALEKYKKYGSRLANIISYNACIGFNTVNGVLIKYEEFFTIFLKILQPLRQQKLWG